MSSARILNWYEKVEKRKEYLVFFNNLNAQDNEIKSREKIEK